MTIKLSLSVLRTRAGNCGFVVTFSDGEYRIAPSLLILEKVCPGTSRAILRAKQESLAYYTNDYNDAVKTLDSMNDDIDFLRFS